MKFLAAFREPMFLSWVHSRDSHSYMLQKAGAHSVTAIESNSRAFLKCLCVKEICNLKNVKFMLGDCVEYLQSEYGPL